jgi:hypothetical protein
MFVDVGRDLRGPMFYCEVTMNPGCGFMLERWTEADATT